MVKSFLFDGKLLETRLLMRFDATTWVGYTYKWDEAQTDATLVGDGSRTDELHDRPANRRVELSLAAGLPEAVTSPEASYVLGTETAQMNRVVGGTNQIDKLSAMGVFDAPVAKPYKAALVTPTPSQAGTPPASATIEQRATSYLHANCGFCHRPADDIDCFSDPCQDLRFGLPLAERNLCNTMPSKGNLGVDGRAESGARGSRQIPDLGPYDEATRRRPRQEGPDAAHRLVRRRPTGRRPDRRVDQVDQRLPIGPDGPFS